MHLLQALVLFCVPRKSTYFYLGTNFARPPLRLFPKTDYTVRRISNMKSRRAAVYSAALLYVNIQVRSCSPLYHSRVR